MQQEVAAQHSIANTDASIRDLTAAAGFDIGEFMLLPEDIRQELLEQARHDQAAVTNAAMEMLALPDPVTHTPFLSPPAPPAPAPKQEPRVESSIYEFTIEAGKRSRWVNQSLFRQEDFPVGSSRSDLSHITKKRMGIIKENVTRTYAVPIHNYFGGSVAELLPLALAKVNSTAAVETAAEKATDPIAEEDFQPAGVVLCVGDLNMSDRAALHLSMHWDAAGISPGRKDLIIINPGCLGIDNHIEQNCLHFWFSSIHHICAGLPWRDDQGKLYWGEVASEPRMKFDAYGDIARALGDFENGFLYEFPDGCDKRRRMDPDNLKCVSDTPSNERFTLQKGPSRSHSIEFIEKATGAIFSTKRVPVAPRWPQEVSFVQELTAACQNWCSAGREVVFINGCWFCCRYRAGLVLCKEGSGGERIPLYLESGAGLSLENDYLEGCSYLVPFVRELHTSHPDLFSYCVQGKRGTIHSVRASSLLERIDTATATSDEKDGDDGVGVGFGVGIGDGGKDSVAVSQPNQSRV